MGFPIETDDLRARRASARDGVAHAIAVVGGCGYVPVAPGTAGSFAGACAFVLVALGFDAAGEAVGFGPATRSLGAGAGASAAMATFLGLQVAIVVALTGLGTWAAGRAERRFGRHDDGRIVIDEVAGQWVALLPLAVAVVVAPGPWSEIGSFEFFGAVVTGFVLFRVFDVWKPGWIRRVERRFDGGWGVMADDLVAGVHAALVLSPLLYLAGRFASPLPAALTSLGARA